MRRISNTSLRIWLLIILWLLAIALAATCDRAIATSARASGVESFFHEPSHKWLRELLRIPGQYGFTIPVAIVATWIHPRRWRAGAFLCLATAVSGVNGLIKWMVGRMRPFKWDESGRLAPLDFRPFRGGLAGLFDSKNLCFPSGDVTLAFATAASAAILWPRGRWFFYAIAIVVAAERVAENAHWLSDCVAGAALGIGGVHLIRWLFGRRLLAREMSVTELWAASAPGAVPLDEKR
jgi:membrane-associated phospholipid phosphatase